MGEEPLGLLVTSLSDLPNEVKRRQEAARRGGGRHFKVPWLLGPDGRQWQRLEIGIQAATILQFRIDSSGAHGLRDFSLFRIPILPS